MNPQLKKVVEELKALRTQQRGIVDAAETANRDVTPEEESIYQDCETKVRGLEVRRQRLEELAEAESKLPKFVISDPDTIKIGEPNFSKDPKLGFASTQEFFRSVLAHGMENPGPVRRERVADERLKMLVTAGSDEAGTYSDPYGGFLVPTGFLPNLMALAAETDPTVGRTQAVPMASPRVEIPARTDKTHTSSVSGGLRVYRRSETQAVTASRMETELIALQATPLMGLAYATEELISDSAISFVALLEAGFRDEFASKILREKIRGTGVGQMEGVLSTPALLSVTGAGNAAEILFEDIVNMRARCYGYQNAIWLYNHDCLPQLAQMVMPIGTAGVAMWQNSAREGEPDMLWGRPCFPTEYCSTVGTVGDIILGDWSQYLEGTYKPLESAESLHVRFEYNERTFRFLLRNDGRCWWRSALTPAVSSTTLSPFVVIGTRS